MGGRGRRRGGDAARQRGAGGSGWRRPWPAQPGLTGCSSPTLPLRQPRGHRASGFWPGTQTCPQHSPWCSPRTPLPKLTCHIAWSGGQPVPPSQPVMAVPAGSRGSRVLPSQAPHPGPHLTQTDLLGAPVLLVPELMCLLGFKPLFLSFLFSSITRESRGRCSGEQPRDSYYIRKLLFCHPKTTHVTR